MKEDASANRVEAREWENKGTEAGQLPSNCTYLTRPTATVGNTADSRTVQKAKRPGGSKQQGEGPGSPRLPPAVWL